MWDPEQDGRGVLRQNVYRHYFQALLSRIRPLVDQTVRFVNEISGPLPLFPSIIASRNHLGVVDCRDQSYAADHVAEESGKEKPDEICAPGYCVGESGSLPFRRLPFDSPIFSSSLSILPSKTRKFQVELDF